MKLWLNEAVNGDVEVVGLYIIYIPRRKIGKIDHSGACKALILLECNTG